MKNLFNKFAKVLVAVAFIFAFSSCEKEDVNPDPQPSTTTTTSGGSTTTTNSDGTTTTTTTTTNSDGTVVVVTNTTPTIDATVSLTGSNSIDVLDFTNDIDNDNVALVSITGASNGTITQSGSSISYTPTNALWVGTENLIVTISDGTETVTANVTLTYGSNAQIATYNLISPYLDNRFLVQSLIPNLLLKSDGTLESLPSPEFYGDLNATSGSYVILENGKFEMVIGINVRSFTITAYNNNGLTFTGHGHSLNVWN